MDNNISSPLFDYDTLVLSGNSSKGLTVLGALHYAYENFLLKNIKTFIGTSSGCIICYLLIIGYTPIEIMVYICTNQLMEKMQNMNLVAMIQMKGACSYTHIQEQIEKMTIYKIGYLPTLNDLKKKYNKTLVCATHNLSENKTEYLSWETCPDLPCVTALRMSSNLPLIFETFKYGDSYYTDGAVSDNFPIDIGEKLGNKILGIVLGKNENNFSKEPDIGVLEFIYKLIFVSVNQTVKYKIQQVSYDKVKIIDIKHNDKLRLFEFNINNTNKFEMFSIGYQHMKKEYDE